MSAPVDYEHMTGLLTRRRILLAVLTIFCLTAGLVLSGCAWKGKGKEVATAIQQNASVKTRAFTGSMSMKLAGATAAGVPSETTITFSGAVDNSNPASPLMHMKMNFEGTAMEMVQPGNGSLYVTTKGKTYSVPVPATDASKSSVDPQKIYVALGSAIGHFQDSPMITNAKGVQVKTISATVDKGKLCGPVLQAFGSVMNTSGGMTSGFEKGLGGGSAGLAGFCKAMLKKDPRVWFGIDNGALTDVALNAVLTIPLAGSMTLDVQYHEYDQNKPQTGFDVPPNATPLPSMEALGTTAAA